MVSIIPATENDIQRILEIEQEAISPPWTHGALLSEIYKEDSYFVVAFDEQMPLSADDTAPSAISNAASSAISNAAPATLNNTAFSAVVGFAVLRQVGDDGELLQIAVDKAKRRGGVGELLMIAALEYARENTPGSIFLEVRRGNTAAIGLYKKHGFSSVRIRKDYYSDPVEDAIVMIRRL